MILAILWVVFSEDLPMPPCLFKTLTGYPCPGCGGTRAAYALLHGDLLRALLINPLSCLLIIFYMAMLVWALRDGYKKDNSLYRFLTKQWDIRLLVTIIATILIVWICNIKKGL